MSPLEVSPLIMFHESNKSIIAKGKRSMLNQGVSDWRISNLEQTNPIKPWLSRANQNSSILQKLNHLLTHRTERPLRGRHHFSHHVSLMVACWACCRREEGVGKTMIAAVDDVMTNWHEALRIKLV